MGQKSHFHKLRKRWLKRHDEARQALLAKHSDAIDWLSEKVPGKEHIASAAIGALMLTNTLPTATALPSFKVEQAKEESSEIHYKDSSEFTGRLGLVLPKETRPLTPEEETAVGQLLSEEFDMKISAELEGRRLNRSFGYIGAEQHLMRYPGDTMAGHLSDNVESNKFFFSSGMAPGRGAWGYFAKSKVEMTQKDVEREKWYIAAQTFLAPGFSDNVGDRYKWFKFRKMILVNPKNGQAVVTVIGDAGPAQWTGKHLGGSPEVMTQLGLHRGSRKGGVLYFFIEDPDDKIPLGPI